MPQVQFVPALVNDVDVPVMVGGNTAIFYAYYGQPRYPGDPPTDNSIVRQRPEFLCRSEFSEFTVELSGPLPAGMELVVTKDGKSAYFGFTTSQVSAEYHPTRLTATITCTTAGGTEVKPPFWDKDRDEQEIPPEDRMLPYANYWIGTTVVFTVQVTIHNRDEPWLTGVEDQGLHGWFGDLNMVCEAGRYVARDYMPRTTLEWEPGYVPGGVPDFIFILLSEIQVGWGAFPREHEYALWINKTIYMLDEFGEMDTNRPSGLQVRFPGIGENPLSLTGLWAEGPVTIWGVPREVGNAGVEVRLRFDATEYYKGFKGWQAYDDFKTIMIPITIVEKFAPPGRAVILHQTPSHVEDRIWMSSQEDELSSNTLGGSWYDKAAPGGAVVPGGGNPVPPVPPPVVGPTTPNTLINASITAGSTTVTITTAGTFKLGDGVVGAGIPSGAYVTRVDDTGKVLELSVAATETRLTDLAVGPPPTGTTGTKVVPRYSRERPDNLVILTDTWTFEDALISLIPGYAVNPSYGPTGGGEDRSISVPAVAYDVSWFRPLAYSPYYVDMSGIPYPAVDYGNTGALSALLYPHPYNLAADIDVPAPSVNDPSTRPLDDSPYYVDMAGIPVPSIDYGDSGALSALLYPHPYNPATDVNVGSVSTSDITPGPFST